MTDQQEFTELLETNLRALNRFVLGLVRNDFDAAEVVQETATKAFIHFADFRAEANFKTWLMSIALNEVRQRRRRESRSRVSYLGYDQLMQLTNARSNHSPYRDYQEKEAAQLVEDALGSLHPAYKTVVCLRAFDGLGVSDTARELSLSIPAVKARYHRAVRQLAQTLARRTKRPLLGAIRAAENS